MEELLRTAFTVGQQWVHDMYNDKEVVSFNEWYNSDEVQQQVKILNKHFVSNNEAESEVAVCPACGVKHTETDCGGYCSAWCLQGYP